MTVDSNVTEMTKSLSSRGTSAYSTSLKLFTDIENVIGNYACTAGNRYGTRTSQTLSIKGIVKYTIHSYWSIIIFDFLRN